MVGLIELMHGTGGVVEVVVTVFFMFLSVVY